MGTFNEARAPTSRKHAAEKVIVMPNWTKSFETSWLHCSVFVLKMQLKNLKNQSFLPLGDSLVATFNELRASSSRKDVAEQGIVMPNWSKTFLAFWLHFSVFALEKQPKNLYFQGFFYL